MSRTSFVVASLAAAVLATSAFAGDANLFTNSGVSPKAFSANNATVLGSGGASTMSVDVSSGGTGSNALFSSTASSQGSSDIGKAAFAGLSVHSNGGAAFAAAAKNSAELGK